MHSARTEMLTAVPVRERFLTLAGTRTALHEAGEGPPLVLLHGGIECGGAYWAPVVARLAERHRVLIPDVPGLGESEPVERLGHDAFASWFGALLDATCRERPVLVAHSLLGTLAASFAAEQGDRLSRLIVYASPGVGPYRMPLGLRVVAVRFSLRPTERNAERFDRWAFFDFDSARASNPGWLHAFSEYTRAQAAVPHVKRVMRQLIGTCTKPLADAQLRRIPVPAELVWGRHDRFVPLSLAEKASARLGWPLRVIDRAGHVPHIERTDDFLEAIA
jgi:pimeloyl-ACP methyl ester carboxylesterase